MISYDFKRSVSNARLKDIPIRAFAFLLNL